LGHPGAEACQRHLRLIVSLGISLPCQVIAANLRVALHQGVPQLTAIDSSLQHADSTAVVVLLAGQMPCRDRWCRRIRRNRQRRAEVNTHS
jgi:hypothetical protein